MAQYCQKCGTQMKTCMLENREREVCPKCGWIYYEHLKVGAGVLLEEDGAILMVRRAIEPWKGMWYLPAGYVEVDETPGEAAVRETREETGLVVRLTRLEEVYHFDDDPRGNGLLILYSAVRCGGIQTISNETSEISFFHPSEVPIEIAGKAHQKAVQDWLKRTDHAI